MASKLLLVVVVIVDLIAFGLAIAAEQRKASARLVHNDQTFNHCEYESDISSTLAVGSFTFLLAGQLFIMAASQCLVFGRTLRPGSLKNWAVILFITCWMTFLTAEAFLVVGALKNAYHTTYSRTFLSGVDSPPAYCNTLRKGIFAAAAGLIVLSCILSELFFVIYWKANDFGGYHPNNAAAAAVDINGIGMGNYN